MYQEFLNGGGVKTLDMEEARPHHTTPKKPAEKSAGEYPDLWR
jgi:hypothetical protein